MKQNNKTTTKVVLPELIGKLKDKDKSYSNLSKRMQIMYWILIPIYFILIIVHIIDGSGIKDIIGSFFFLLAMLNFAILFKYYHKEYNTVDYSLPTLIMLKKAVARYQPFQLKTIWALLGIVFIDIGLVLNSSLDFQVLWIQLIFLGTVLFSMGIGLIIWWINYKPLRDAALQLIKELEE